MWVESEVLKGSRFFFTVDSRISHMPPQGVLHKMQPFLGRNILFVDSENRYGEVAAAIEYLGLKIVPIKSANEVKNKATCPHFDATVVDSTKMVCMIVLRSLVVETDTCSGGFTEGERASSLYPYRSAIAFRSDVRP